MSGNYDEWTAAEVNILRRCVNNKLSYAKMLEHLPGRTYSSIKEKRRRLDFPRRRHGGMIGTLKVTIPVHLIAERDQRANEYRTPAQIMLGDPSPLQSALGRACHD